MLRNSPHDNGDGMTKQINPPLHKLKRRSREEEEEDEGEGEGEGYGGGAGKEGEE